MVNELNPVSVPAEEPGADRRFSDGSELVRSAVPHDAGIVTRYRAVAEHLHCDLNGEAVVLSLANGRYYGMNSVAARIWGLVQEARTVDEIEQAILLEYDVELDVCRKQVSDFLQRMVAEELLVVIHESGPEIP